MLVFAHFILVNLRPNRWAGRQPGHLCNPRNSTGSRCRTSIQKRIFVKSAAILVTRFLRRDVLFGPWRRWPGRAACSTSTGTSVFDFGSGTLRQGAVLLAETWSGPGWGTVWLETESCAAGSPMVAAGVGRLGR